MSAQRIDIGHSVRVNFNTTCYTLTSRAVVLSMPLNVSDSWIFKDEVNGALHYVSEGCTVTLVCKKDSPQ